MRMGRYLLRRLLFFTMVLFAISLLTFVFYRNTALSGNPGACRGPSCLAPEQLDAARLALGLDRPIWVQYARMAKGFLPWPGWFLNQRTYYSHTNMVPARSEITGRLPVTGALVAGGLGVSLLLGMLAGLGLARTSTKRHRSFLLSSMAISLPVMLAGFLLQYLFAFRLRVLPFGALPWHGNSGLSFAGTGHMGDVQGTHTVVWGVFHGYFVLPWLALATSAAAVYARRVRFEFGRTLETNDVRPEVAAGLRRGTLVRHGLRQVFGALLGWLGGDLWILVGSVLLVEIVFHLPGIGLYTVRALIQNNTPSLAGVIAFLSVVMIGANLLFDVILAKLDPRVTYA